MRRGLIGLILLAVVAVVLTQTNLGRVLQRGAALAPVKVAIYYGGEKSALLAEPAVQKILTDRHAITLDAIDTYFASLGFMESSSADLFANFLKQGMGARPLIVRYENQLVDFVVANQNYAQLIRDKIKVIYPEPTIFASHPLISLTPTCKRLVTALTDAELQKLAWTQHGFRTGLIGIDNKPSDVAAITLPETVQQVVPMPSAATMRALVALQ